MIKKKKVMRKEVVEKSILPDLTPGFSIQRDQSCPGPNAKRKLKTEALWSKIEKKHRQNSRLIIHCPMSEGVSKVSERANE